MDHDARLLIFAKSPDPGGCKTRLAPFLGTIGAARLHAKLVQRSARVFSRQDDCRAELWCTPDTEHLFFQQLHKRFQIPLYAQHQGDLGVKMAQAAEQRLRQYPRVIIMGTDCPVLETRHLAMVLDDLHNGYDCSIIPAEDGGYVMIGLRCFHPTLFTSIAWGSDQVMEQTATRLENLGWKWQRHQALWDIDREGDYLRLFNSNIMI